MKMKDTHKYYYSLAVANNMPPCGEGSRSDFLIECGTINYISSLIDRHNIKSISDCPCGLFENWIYLLNLQDREVDYKGYDINDLVIKRNSEKFSYFNFLEFDMTKEILPKSDLIICRDCLFHLPNKFVISTLNNFKLSRSMYLLATEQRWLTQNRELTTDELLNESGNKPINLEIEPFNLGTPLESFDERGAFAGERGIRSMSLWKIN